MKKRKIYTWYTLYGRHTLWFNASYSKNAIRANLDVFRSAPWVAVDGDYPVVMTGYKWPQHKELVDAALAYRRCYRECMNT
jgi:hypothetical protein